MIGGLRALDSPLGLWQEEPEPHADRGGKGSKDECRPDVVLEQERGDHKPGRQFVIVGKGPRCESDVRGDDAHDGICEKGDGHSFDLSSVWSPIGRPPNNSPRNTAVGNSAEKR